MNPPPSFDAGPVRGSRRAGGPGRLRRVGRGAGLGTLVLLGACQHYRPAPIDARATASVIEARSLGDPALRTVVEDGLHRPFAEWPPKEWDLPALTLVALHFHPGLEVARARWEVARAGVLTAGGRLNPVLGVTPGISANPAAGVSPWFPSVTLDVPIETAGKRTHRLAVAGHRCEEARMEFVVTAWEIRSRLRTALVEAWAWERRVALLAARNELEDTLVGLLEQRLAAGAAGAPEVVAARLARIRVVAELADARARLLAARASLGEALGVPGSAVDSLRPAPDPLRATREVATTMLAPAARDRALTRRAELLASLAAYAAAESTLRLEMAKQYPDLHLNPGYQFDQGEHKWSLGLSVELPVLNRNQGPIAEAAARRDEAAARFLALQTRVIAEVDQAVRAHAAARGQVDLMLRLRDEGRRQSEGVRAAFEAGGADRFEVTTARLEANLVEGTVLDAEERADVALGRLEDAVQEPFDGLELLERGLEPAMAKGREP